MLSSSIENVIFAKLLISFVFSCSKELNQWEPLTEYGQSKGHSNPYLVLECAWRVSNWAAMKEALVQVRGAQFQYISIYICVCVCISFYTHSHRFLLSLSSKGTNNSFTGNRNSNRELSLTKSQTQWSL